MTAARSKLGSDGGRLAEVRTSLATAVVAGFTGSLAMDVAQDVFDLLFERGRGADDRDEETEAIVSVVRRIAPYVPGHLAERHPGIAGRALHYFFGGAFSLAYAFARERRGEISAANGCAFGAMLWFLSDVVLIPSAHFGRPLFRYSRAERGNALVSHLVYGAIVEAMLRAA